MKAPPKRGPTRGIQKAAGRIPRRTGTKRAVAGGDRGIADKLKRIAWRDLELFLALVESGSLRGTATKLGHAVATIRARLGRVEDELGQLIAGRGRKGLTLTPAGEQLLRIASEMRSSREDVTDEQARDRLPNHIRIAVTEGLGTYWLVPRIIEFQKAHPELMVDLHCDMQLADVAGGEFDIAIQLERPANRRVICNRIAALHLMPFASDQYLRAAGMPHSVDDWRSHRLVWQEAEQVASHLLPFFTGTEDIGDLIGIVTNSSSAHFRAIASGGGIGFLPTYARAISRRVRPIDIGVHLKREVFCVVNSESAGIDAVRDAVNWLETAFSGETYPWFRDAFVDPRDFEEAISSAGVISLFEGFIDGINGGVGLD